MSTKQITFSSSGLQNVVLTKYQDDEDFFFWNFWLERNERFIVEQTQQKFKKGEITEKQTMYIIR